MQIIGRNPWVQWTWWLVFFNLGPEAAASTARIMLQQPFPTVQLLVSSHTHSLVSSKTEVCTDQWRMDRADENGQINYRERWGKNTSTGTHGSRARVELEEVRRSTGTTDGDEWMHQLVLVPSTRGRWSTRTCGRHSGTTSTATPSSPTSPPLGRQYWSIPNLPNLLRDFLPAARRRKLLRSPS
jgi:hypothetical protein